jgi:hypothetical protein
VKLKFIPLFLVSTTVFADGSVVNLNSLPIFYTMTGSNPLYQTATSKAQEAFILQTGVTQNVNQASDKISGDLTDKATYLIDNNTPLKASYVMVGGGAAYAILVKKQITRKVKDPFFKNVTYTISVSQHTQSLGIQIAL